MAHSFTKTQFDSFNELFSTFLPPPTLPTSAPRSAPPSAVQLCTPAPSDLPPQPISAPAYARSHTSSPSVETIEEVEKQIYNPLRNIRQMRKKLGDLSRKMPTSPLLFDRIRMEWSTIFGGSNMRFPCDESLNAWYTTMLNHTHKLATRGAISYRA